jgi:hypothetical protein
MVEIFISFFAFQLGTAGLIAHPQGVGNVPEALVYLVCFVDDNGILSSFRVMRKTVESRCLFSSFFSDSGLYYW